MRSYGILLGVLFLVPGMSLELAQGIPESSPLRLTEVVADPQLDWNEDGALTSSDEFVELWNGGAAAVDLMGWRLWLNDTTPVTWNLTGLLESGQRRAFVNPPGELNNNGQVALLDPSGVVTDSVTFGSWPGNGAGLPSARSNTTRDESLRRVAGTWGRGHATPDAPEDAPFFRHASPFEEAGGIRWDPGNRSRDVEFNWTDSLRTYLGARLEVTAGDALETFNRSLAPGAMEGTLRWSLVTPRLDFSYRWSLWDANETVWPGPKYSVRVDADPPEAPRLVLPAWTNATSLPLPVASVLDAGVGGVEYRVEVQPEGSDSWTALDNWSASTMRGSTDLGSSRVLSFRAWARDRFGHAVVGPAQEVRIDRTPPPAPEGVEASGIFPVQLHWAIPTDVDSGIDTLRITRVAGGPLHVWELPSNTSAMSDDGATFGADVAYRVEAIDRAGNVGPAWEGPLDYEGRHPHLRGLRLSAPVWGSSVLRVHADFDRPMDEDRDPDVALRVGGAERALTGRWLANGSTYLIVLDPDEEWFQGTGEVEVRQSFDAQGRSLWAPASRPLKVDRDVPTLTWNDVEGWVGPQGLELRAQDSLDPAPFIRWSTSDEPGLVHEATAEVRVPLSNATRIRAFAEDAAHRRSPETSRSLRLDAQAPSVEPLGWQGRGPQATWRFRVRDAQAGVDADGIRAWTIHGPLLLEPTSAEDTFRVSPPEDSELYLLAADRVGNSVEAQFHVAAPPASIEPTPGPPALPEVASSQFREGQEHVPLAARAPTLLADKGAESSVTHMGVVGVAAVGALGTAAASWARRTPPRSGVDETPSLARRLQVLRNLPASAQARLSLPVEA